MQANLLCGATDNRGEKNQGDGDNPHPQGDAISTHGAEMILNPAKANGAGSSGYLHQNKHGRASGIIPLHHLGAVDKRVGDDDVDAVHGKESRAKHHRQITMGAQVGQCVTDPADSHPQIFPGWQLRLGDATLAKPDKGGNAGDQHKHGSQWPDPTNPLKVFQTDFAEQT